MVRLTIPLTIRFIICLVVGERGARVVAAVRCNDAIEFDQVQPVDPVVIGVGADGAAQRFPSRADLRPKRNHG
jgi:hypothetical protein